MSLQKGEKTLSVEDLQKALGSRPKAISGMKQIPSAMVYEKWFDAFELKFSVFLKDYEQENAVRIELVKNEKDMKIEALQLAILTIYKPEIEKLKRKLDETHSLVKDNVHVPRKQLSEWSQRLHDALCWNEDDMPYDVEEPEDLKNLVKELFEASDSLSPKEVKDVAIARKELASGKCKTFKTADEMIVDLHKKHQELSGYLSSPREGIKKRKEATRK